MTRVRNATEFQLRLSRTIANYENRYRGAVEEVRARYSANPSGQPPPKVDEALEAHLRHYFVNGFLNALNWRLELTPDEGLPNLIPEVPIESLERGTTRFLDYLGSERETNRPLLVVETKRPSSRLPQRRNSTIRLKGESTADLICKRVTGTDKTDLGTEWNEWVDTLSDYVRSVHGHTGDAPRRVVITNGRWLIVFIDPADTFLEGGAHSPESVLVYNDSEHGATEVETRFEEIFGLLEHQRVLNKTRPLVASQLRFRLDPEVVDQVMHGLRVKYIEREGMYAISPAIEVSPILFVRSRFGAWLRIESQRTDDIPHREQELADHFQRVERIASQLLHDVNDFLRSGHVPVSLETHYADGESFKELPGVSEIRHEEQSGASQELLIVTGSNVHYLLREPTVPDCRYHDWLKSREDGYEFRSAIEIRSVDPRSFFTSREIHHCSNSQVAAAKAEPIDANRERFGSRSGRDGEAFCEIWRLDEYLCCRTCVFQAVCEKADVFRLPCHVPDS